MAITTLYKMVQQESASNIVESISFDSYQLNDIDKSNVSKIEIMECLGLKDKCNKKIHFGDILLDECNDTFLTPVIEINNDEHVLYFKPLQHLKSKLNIGCKSTHSNTLKVVGNIYYNSELYNILTNNYYFINLVISRNKQNNATINIDVD